MCDHLQPHYLVLTFKSAERVFFIPRNSTSNLDTSFFLRLYTFKDSTTELQTHARTRTSTTYKTQKKNKMLRLSGGGWWVMFGPIGLYVLVTTFYTQNSQHVQDSLLRFEIKFHSQSTQRNNVYAPLSEVFNARGILKWVCAWMLLTESTFAYIHAMRLCARFVLKFLLYLYAHNRLQTVRMLHQCTQNLHYFILQKKQRMSALVRLLLYYCCYCATDAIFIAAVLILMTYSLILLLVEWVIYLGLYLNTSSLRFSLERKIGRI